MPAGGGVEGEAVVVDADERVEEVRDQRLRVQLGEGLRVREDHVAEGHEAVAEDLVLHVGHGAVTLERADEGLAVGQVERLELLGRS